MQKKNRVQQLRIQMYSIPDSTAYISDIRYLYIFDLHFYRKWMKMIFSQSHSKLRGQKKHRHPMPSKLLLPLAFIKGVYVRMENSSIHNNLPRMKHWIRMASHLHNDFFGGTNRRKWVDTLGCPASISKQELRPLGKILQHMSFKCWSGRGPWYIRKTSDQYIHCFKV